jgi:hypothetical protein
LSCVPPCAIQQQRTPQAPLSASPGDARLEIPPQSPAKRRGQRDWHDRVATLLSRMKLIFLHGAPAAGKLTVAQALLRAVPGRLFDNHAAIDVALTAFEFGAPGFWELVHVVRSAVIDKAASHGVSLMVIAYCYAEPDDRAAFEEFDAIVQRHGGELLPVFLHCAKQEILRRLGGEDRARRRKITSADGLARFLARYNMAPVPRASCLELDSGARSAEDTAREIVRHFRLQADAAA